MENFKVNTVNGLATQEKYLIYEFIRNVTIKVTGSIASVSYPELRYTGKFVIANSFAEARELAKPLCQNIEPDKLRAIIA